MGIELNPVAREFYTVFYGQAVSPKQDLIALCNNFGQLLAVPVYQNDGTELPQLIHQYETNIFSISTLKRSNTLLAGAQNGNILAFDWNHIVQKDSDTIQPLWSISTNFREANSICAMNDESMFAIGYGDGILEIRDCTNPGKVIVEFNGHKEQVNQVVPYAANQVVSCSSDGTVNLYDALAGPGPVKSLNIRSHNSVIRSGHSRAVYAVGVQDQFIICGGGLEVAKFDISSGHLLQLFTSSKYGSNHYNVHSIEISRDKIGLGTSHGSVLGFGHGGNFINEIPLGTGPVLNLNSIHHDSHRHLLTAASGVNSKVSMIVNYGYVSYNIGTIC